MLFILELVYIVSSESKLKNKQLAQNKQLSLMQNEIRLLTNIMDTNNWQYFAVLVDLGIFFTTTIQVDKLYLRCSQPPKIQGYFIPSSLTVMPTHAAV